VSSEARNLNSIDQSVNQSTSFAGIARRRTGW